MIGSTALPDKHAECEHPKGGTPRGTSSIPKIVQPELTRFLLESGVQECPPQSYTPTVCALGLAANNWRTRTAGFRRWRSRALLAACRYLKFHSAEMPGLN